MEILTTMTYETILVLFLLFDEDDNDDPYPTQNNFVVGTDDGDKNKIVKKIQVLLRTRLKKWKEEGTKLLALRVISPPHPKYHKYLVKCITIWLLAQYKIKISLSTNLVCLAWHFVSNQ